jgi:hypothetical protein
MDREVEQLLVQFPGPIRFLLSRPRNRFVSALDLIRMPLFFFLLALTTSHTPGWLSWLPFWIASLFILGIPGICLFWLFGWVSFRVAICSTLGMFLLAEGFHSEPNWTMFYFSIAGLIVFSGLALPLIAALLADPGCLVLDQEGFEIKQSWSKTLKVPWANASRFEVGAKSGLVMYGRTAKDDTTLGKLRKLLGNPKSNLPCTEGFTAESLAFFMTQWRERALNN